MNLMVMAPGGCRFGDYWKLGLPLLLLSLVVVFLVPVSGGSDLRRRMHGRARCGRPGRRSLLRLDGPPAVTRAGAAEVDAAYERYRTVEGGETSRVYPALARVPADLFGICAVGTSGSVDAAGDAEVGFTIMSVAKPFVFALVCQALGSEEVRRRVG